MSEEVGKKTKTKKVSSDILEIVGKFSSNRSSSEDEVTKILDEQIKMLAKQAKAKMLKKMVLEHEKEINELEKIVNRTKSMGEQEKISISTPSNHFDIDVRIAAELAKLPEDERQKVIQTYTMLRAAERDAANPNVMLPLLIGFQKENKDSSPEMMYQWAKMQLDAMKTAFELAKTDKKGDGDTNIQTWLTIFKEMMQLEKESRQKEFELLMKKLDEMRQPGFLDQLLFNPEIRNTLKEIGLFSPPKSPGLDPRIQLEIEKMRMEHEREMKKMEMQLQMKMQELQNEQNKMLMMLQGLGQIGRAAVSAITEEGLLSENTTAMQQPPQSEKAEAKNLENEIVTLECPNCGSNITFPRGAKRVTCPSCNSMYEVKASEEK